MADGDGARILTEVVLTPHSSNFSNVGVGALGVSMNSNSLSEPLTLCGSEDMIAASSNGIRRRDLENSTRFLSWAVVGEGQMKILLYLGSVLFRTRRSTKIKSSVQEETRS